MEIKRVQVLEYKKKVEPLLREYSKRVGKSIRPDWGKLNILQSMGHLQAYSVVEKGEFIGFFLVTKDVEVFNTDITNYKLVAIYLIPSVRHTRLITGILDFLKKEYEGKNLVAVLPKRLDRLMKMNNFKTTGVIYGICSPTSS